MSKILMKTKVIFVHGVGDQPTNFADSLIDNIRNVAGRSLAPIEFNEFLLSTSFESLVWADSIGSQINDYNQLMYTKPGLFWGLLTKRIDPLVLQILSYVRQKDKSILDDFAADFKRATEGADKVIVVAHSLGTVIAFDYLLKHSDTKVDCLITMGSPLPLFAAAMGHLEGLTILPPNIGRWFNIYSKRDAIAKSLSLLFPVKDVEVKTKFWPIAAHTGYWQNKATAKVIAEVLCRK